MKFPAMPIVILLVVSLCAFPGCGGKDGGEEARAEVAEAATAFLDALGDLRVEGLREMLTEEYLSSNQVPELLTADHVVAALGYLNSYRFSPDVDIALNGDRAVITLVLDISGIGEKEETLAMQKRDGAWKVDAFTAMDWSRKPPPKRGEDEEERVEVEEALREFLIACLDGRTDYVFQHLSKGYKERHRLERPWTSAEFSGIFGRARSYDFKPQEIEMEKDSAEVDVTIEFGSTGNLEPQTSRVRLVKETGGWYIDVFPFFLY